MIVNCSVRKHFGVKNITRGEVSASLRGKERKKGNEKKIYCNYSIALRFGLSLLVHAERCDADFLTDCATDDGSPEEDADG